MVGTCFRSVAVVLVEEIESERTARILLKTGGDRAFQLAALKLWDRVPITLRSMDSVDAFKNQLKTHLFRQAF